MLERPIDGSKTMADQLKRLLEYPKPNQVKVRVLPTGKGADPGLDGPFTVLTIGSGNGVSRVAHAEHALGHSFRFEDRGEDVQEIDERFERLWALTDQDMSVGILRDYVARYDNEPATTP
jgi:hypothetical protein